MQNKDDQVNTKKTSVLFKDKAVLTGLLISLSFIILMMIREFLKK